MSEWPPQSPLDVAVRCACPRCGRGKLFRGVLTVVDRCAVCDLDLRSNDTGDGPAVCGEGKGLAGAVGSLSLAAPPCSSRAMGSSALGPCACAVPAKVQTAKEMAMRLILNNFSDRAALDP